MYLAGGQQDARIVTIGELHVPRQISLVVIFLSEEPIAHEAEGVAASIFDVEILCSNVADESLI